MRTSMAGPGLGLRLGRVAAMTMVLVLAARLLVGQEAGRPNILLAISDDQSYPHAGVYGAAELLTPAFDRVAREGVLFRNGFCASPGCSPSRAALLTGRHTWQLREAGTHASSFPADLATFPELLQSAGYFVGYTGKGWGPGNWKISGRERNPAGPAFSSARLADDAPRPGGASKLDYAGNFEQFLSARPAGTPFCFWFGASEPHRGFAAGSGLQSGKRPERIDVPKFLPNVPAVRSDLADYYLEIEHFDRHLQRMLAKLEAIGELERTLVVVTSDNGMAFPRAKANCYEFGIHVPLAIRWGAARGGRVVDDLVGFVDLAPTFLEAAGVPVDPALVGRSLVPLLAGQPGAERSAVFAARERHSSSRYQNLGYPQRAMRTARHLLIRNFRPQRWPAGAPRKYVAKGKLGPPHGAYHDIDACPTLTLLVQGREDPQLQPFLALAVDKRPEYELFDIVRDPACLHNLAQLPEHEALFDQLREQLNQYLRRTGDPRVLDGGDVFESYRRYSAIREFPPDESE